MKIRNGFVSNSSSSSFVIYGYKLTKEFINHLEDKKVIFIQDGDYISDAIERITLPKNVSYLYNEPDCVIGYVIADISSEDGGMDDNEIDLPKFEKIRNNLKSLFKTDKDPKLITGTRPC